MTLSQQKAAAIVIKLLDWFAANARVLPWRRTRDPYAIWVSEIMLQQTQVKTVIPYWKRWMRELPDIQAVAEAGPDKIHKLWEGLGYYTRARNLQKAARQIVAQQNAHLKTCTRRREGSQIKKKSETPYVVSYKFPDHFDDVLALPGIGRYTAGAICSIAFNQPVPILDGNVIRVLTRIFGIAENPREKKTNVRLWHLAEALVSHAAASSFVGGRRHTEPHALCISGQRLLTSPPACSWFNQSLMELGALICTPRNPQCPDCPVKKLCVAFRENRVGELPKPGKRPPSTARRFLAFVVERQGRFLVQQRPAGGVNAHLWEFPNVEIEARRCNGRAGQDPSAQGAVRKGQSRHTSAATLTEYDPETARAANRLGFELCDAKPLWILKHSITRYRMTLEAFRARLGRADPAGSKRLGTGRNGAPPPETAVWKTPAGLRRLAFAGAHRKLLANLNRRT